jgi:hypothetical protein
MKENKVVLFILCIKHEKHKIEKNMFLNLVSEKLSKGKTKGTFKSCVCQQFEDSEAILHQY